MSVRETSAGAPPPGRLNQGASVAGPASRLISKHQCKSARLFGPTSSAGTTITQAHKFSLIPLACLVRHVLNDNRRARTGRPADVKCECYCTIYTAAPSSVRSVCLFPLAPARLTSSSWAPPNECLCCACKLSRCFVFGVGVAVVVVGVGAEESSGLEGAHFSSALTQ